GSSCGVGRPRSQLDRRHDAHSRQRESGEGGPNVRALAGLVAEVAGVVLVVPLAPPASDDPTRDRLSADLSWITWRAGRHQPVPAGSPHRTAGRRGWVGVALIVEATHRWLSAG